MITSTDVENQVSLARNALISLPDMTAKLNSFIEVRIQHRMCTQPEEAADDLFTWLKELPFGERKKEEVLKFLLLLKQAIFVNNITNVSSESFDRFYYMNILPMLLAEKYTEVTKSAWTEFLHIYEVACVKHPYSSESGLLVFLSTRRDNTHH